MITFQVSLTNEEIKKEIECLSPVCKNLPLIIESKKKKKRIKKEKTEEDYKNIALQALGLTEQDLIIKNALKVCGIETELRKE